MVKKLYIVMRIIIDCKNIYSRKFVLRKREKSYMKGNGSSNL